ncbi:MAG: hypothetical protein IJ553_06160 [Alloprevotella sp.]|nr:hypothetical protein [Alloprevotella sp.]
MAKEEAIKYLREEVQDTQAGMLVNQVIVEKAIGMVAGSEELKEKALDCLYDCDHISDWIQLGDAEYVIDVATDISN